MELAASLGKTTWDRVLIKIERKVNAHSFNTWFRPTSQVAETIDRLRVVVPSEMFAEWLKTNYSGLIHATLIRMREATLAGRETLANIEAEAEAALRNAGFAPDYAAIRRAEDLTRPEGDERGGLIALIAARLGPARLIDNLLLDL